MKIHNKMIKTPKKSIQISLKILKKRQKSLKKSLKLKEMKK